MNLVIGQVVSSKAGRDAGNKYIVIGIIDNNYVLVADGFAKKVLQPKKKNIKHLVIHRQVFADLSEAVENRQRITNQQIRDKIASLTFLPKG